jgi:hypothetical protein
VDDAVGDGGYACGNRVERLNGHRGAVGLDGRELQARRAGVDD